MNWMSFPFYKQLDSMDCGPTCLRMVASYFGKAYSIQFLREKSYIDRAGVSMKGISEAAESIGFRTLAVKVAPSDKLTTPPQVEISISDTGPGIPDDLRDHIFEPFVSSKSTGTGLGLAITKRIVTAHHGSINVDSFPGGTVFQLQLPAVHGE